MARIALRLVVLAIAILAVSRPVLADSITINFDSLGEFDSVGTQVPGLTFSNATVLTAGSSLNDLEFPPHSGSNVIVDDGGPMSIAFASPVFGLSGYFSYLAPLTLSAYDSGNNLIASVTSTFLSNLAISGDAGSSPNELLVVTSLSAISFLRISGDLAGGSFVLDDLTCDANPNTPTPEPTTLALLGTGLAMAWGMRRRRAPRSRVAKWDRLFQPTCPTSWSNREGTLEVAQSRRRRKVARILFVEPSTQRARASRGSVPSRLVPLRMVAGQAPEA